MMKKGIAFSVLTFLFLIVNPLFSQTPGYDAEYQKLVKEYILQKDGSWDFHYRKEIKLLTHYSFHRLFGETFIVYNPLYQQLKINEAFTVMADGKKVIVPQNAFNGVLPGFAANIPAYNHLREMVVTHTGTEVGSVITLDYTIHSAGNFLPFFFGMEEIGENVPVKDMLIIVRVPEEIILKERILNSRLAPEVIQLAGQKSYTWSFRDVPALPRSSNQDIEQKTALFFSTAKDMTWAYFSFVNQEAFKSRPGAEISRRVDEVKKDKKSDLDIILALQAVVIDELRPADIPLANSGYKIRTPDEVWKSANATALEKAVLLANMLKLANINACPVASVTNAWYADDMGNPAIFDGFMVQVNPKETGRIYLPVTQKQAQNLMFDVSDKTLIQLDGAIESMRTFREKAVENELEMKGELRLYDGKTVGGEVQMVMEGICHPFFKLRKDSSYVKNMITGDLPLSSVRNIKLRKISELSSEYDLTWNPELVPAFVGMTRNPEPGTSNDTGFFYFDLPRFKTGFDAWNLVQFTGSGDTPVRLDFPLEEDYSFEIILPESYSLFTPPVDIKIENDLGELAIKISQSGSKVKIERSWELYHDVVSSDLMDEFKEMIIAWEKVEHRKIILKSR